MMATNSPVDNLRMVPRVEPHKGRWGAVWNPAGTHRPSGGGSAEQFPLPRSATETASGKPAAT